MISAHKWPLDVSIFVKGSGRRLIDMKKLRRGGEIGQCISSENNRINQKRCLSKTQGFTKRKESKIHLTPFGKRSKQGLIVENAVLNYMKLQYILGWR
jgi:hypothetical protein